MKSSTRKKTLFFGKKMNWSNNIIFFWKSFLTQIVYLNKTKLSFHFEYFFQPHDLKRNFCVKIVLANEGEKSFLWKIREEKKNCSIHGVTVFLHYILSIEVTSFFPPSRPLNLKEKETYQRRLLVKLRFGCNTDQREKNMPSSFDVFSTLFSPFFVKRIRNASRETGLYNTRENSVPKKICNFN